MRVYPLALLDRRGNNEINQRCLSLQDELLKVSNMFTYLDALVSSNQKCKSL